MIEAELPDGRILEFPDDTDPLVIQARVKEFMGITTNAGAQTKPQQMRTDDVDPFKALAKEESKGILGALDTGAIKIGEGIYNVGRGVGLIDQPDQAEQRALEALDKERPIVSWLGKSTGESFPFAISGGLVGQGVKALAPQVSKLGAPLLEKAVTKAAEKLATRAGSAVMNIGSGVAQGAILEKGAGGDTTEQIGGGIAGGVMSGLSEIFGPVIGRVADKFFKNVLKKTPKGTLITPDGLPTPELEDALKSVNLNFDDLQKSTVEIINELPHLANPEQAARYARYKDIDPEFPLLRGDVTKKYQDMTAESRLLGSIQDPAAEPVRQVRIKQSEILNDKLDEVVNEAGAHIDSGYDVKHALHTRKKIDEQEISDEFELVNFKAAKAQDFKIPPIGIRKGIPHWKVWRDVSRRQPQDVQALRDLLTEFGVTQYKDSLSRLEKAGKVVEPLDLTNITEFNKALNNIENYSNVSPNDMSALVGPIKGAYHDTLQKVREKAPSDVANVIDTFFDAKAKWSKHKTEFNSTNIIGRLTNQKSDGMAQVIEASQVYDKLMGKGQPIEHLASVMDGLRKSGKRGEKAIGGLQAKMAFEIIEAATKSKTNTLDGNQLLSGPAMINKMNEIGEAKMKMVFSNNPKGYNQIKKVADALKDLTPDNLGVPKGSAVVNADLVLGLLNKVPVVGPYSSQIMRGLSQLAKMGENKEAAARALNANPDFKRVYGLIEMNAPATLSTLGIAGLLGDREDVESY